MNIGNLTGRRAIVTGGTRGLGKGIVQGFLENGAEVAIIGVSDRVFKVAQEFLAEGYKVHPIQGDLGNTYAIKAIFNDALQALGGKLDILVNNAGIQRRNRCEEFTLEDWQTVIDTNLTSIFQMCQCAGQIMLPQGSGKIINIASLLSFFGGITVPAYAASKGGVAQLTKALSNEWASKGLNINAIAPGYMATEMNTNLINDEGRSTEILARIPQGRWGTAEDMAGLAIFLASQGSDYINGAIIPVDGGYLGR